jgi:beta-glucosidase
MHHWGEGIGAVLKHFVCNDQETARTTISVDVGERALREIYLKPFQIAICEANPWAIMSSYNRLSEVYVSENKALMTDVLRKEWLWDGMVVSDWYATRSTLPPILAGLDLEMPGPARMRDFSVLKDAISAQPEVAEAIEDRANNCLSFYDKVVCSGSFDSVVASVSINQVNQSLAPLLCLVGYGLLLDLVG